MTNPQEFTIKAKLHGFELIFKTTYGLFAYKKIDAGTRLLIENLEIKKRATGLDLGCGYGAIGVVMAKLNPMGKIFMVDRDFVAVDYAKKNADLNSTPNTKVLLSNGFSHLLNKKFGLIASHLPTHISNQMLTWLIIDARKHLNKSGRLYLVVELRLKPFIKRNLTNIFGNFHDLKNSKKYLICYAVKQK